MNRGKKKALGGTDASALINGVVAFARCANPSAENQNRGVKALGKLDVGSLTIDQKLDLTRAYGLLLIRHKHDKNNAQIASKLSGEFPAKSESLNLELARILIAVDAPGIVPRVVERMNNAPSQEEQIHYALCLRVAKNGWTAQARTDYFEWFLKAASLQGGHSFSGFLANIRKEAIANLSKAERDQFKELLAKKPTTNDPYAMLKARPFVKKWKTEDLLEDVNTKLKDRDLENGRQMFGVAQCYKCHRILRQGAVVGPDLTGLGRRYNNKDLLDSLINPNKAVSDQYQATMFMLDSGKTVVGRVANLNGKNYQVIEDMLKPGKFTNVNVDQIEAMKPAKNSMMPEGLLDTLTKDEILDLIAFLKSSVEGAGTFKKKVGQKNKPADASESKVVQNAFESPKPVSSLGYKIVRRTQSQSVASNLAKSTSAGKRSPNIVMIISDDQTWTDYSFMKHPVIKTPNLDRLARESYTFTRGYVPTSLCRPSLMTMITGLYPRQHMVTGNDPGVPAGTDKRQYRRKPEYQKLRNQLISNVDRFPTIPKLLAEKGYKSFQCGKWWEGNFKRGGFTHGMTHGDPKRGGRHGDEGLKIGRKGLEPIREFLTEAGEDPFFIWYAPFLPHTPHNPPKRLVDKYRDKTKHIQMAKYYAMCEWFDETCGELLNELKQRKLDENTIVVYVTDNGWIQRTPDSKLPKGWFTSFDAKSKQSPFDGGLRTPIMIKWPGKIKPAMDSETLVSSIDLMPTLLAAADTKAPNKLPGLNLLPHCNGKQKISRKSLFGEIYAHDIANLSDPSKSLLYEWCIHADEKLIVTHPGKLGPYKTIHSVVNPGKHLYNLKQDPHEETQLKQPTEKLEQLLVKWRDGLK